MAKKVLGPTRDNKRMLRHFGHVHLLLLPPSLIFPPPLLSSRLLVFRVASFSSLLHTWAARAGKRGGNASDLTKIV